MTNKTKTSVSVIIVNWNGGDLLLECLAHLQAQSLPADKILLMDNASTDDSAKKAALIPGISVHFLAKNFGFAKANNLGMQVCDTEWVALLNPDALADKDWLLNLIQATQENPDIAIFGSQQWWLNKPNTLDGVGDAYHISGLISRTGHGQRLSEYSVKNNTIFSPCACAALYRLSALQSVKGFDEDFFCYVEDIDLGFRLQLNNYQARYVPNAIVHHAVSMSTGGKHSDFSLYHGHRNLVWAFIKNMPSLLFWPLLPLHLLLNLVSIIYFSYRGQGKMIRKAKYDALQGIPSMWRKRQVIQANKKVSSFKIWSLLNKQIFFK